MFSFDRLSSAAMLIWDLTTKQATRADAVRGGEERVAALLCSAQVHQNGAAQSAWVRDEDITSYPTLIVVTRVEAW